MRPVVGSASSVLRQRGLLPDVLDVDHRGRPRDRDRFLERPHFQLAIHRSP